MAEAASTLWAMTVEDGGRTVKALPPPVCVLDTDSNTPEVVLTALKVEVAELEMAEVTSTPALMTVEECGATVKAPPPPVCVLDTASDTSEVATTALRVDEAELELASTVAVAIEEGTVIVTAPPPPVCALEVVSDGCAAAKMDTSLDWTAVVAADEGSVTVIPRPPTACFFDVIADVLNSVELELPLGWIVAVIVDEGTVTVTAAPSPACVTGVVADVFDCVEVASSVGCTVVVAVDDGTVTVTAPPFPNTSAVGVASTAALGVPMMELADATSS